jgi:hypothetical protein
MARRWAEVGRERTVPARARRVVKRVAFIILFE